MSNQFEALTTRLLDYWKLLADAANAIDALESAIHKGQVLRDDVTFARVKLS